MIEKLAKIKEKYIQISERLQDPQTIADQNLFRDLNKEYKNLAPVVEAYDRFLAIPSSIAFIVFRSRSYCLHRFYSLIIKQ